MEIIYIYTIKLIRYVLNGDIPELPENIDFEALYTFGRGHGVENMLYVGLRDLNISVTNETMEKFKTAYEMQIMVEAVQALELEAIGEAFEEAGIDYIPLKGSVVKYLYPMPDYRKSGDIDILIKEEAQESACGLAEKLGYKYNYIFNKHDVHFEFEKPPYMILELHRRLVGESNRAYGFARQIWNYANLTDGHKHRYELDINYMYVYLIAHIAKHLSGGGAGIKLINDIWLMKKENRLDREKTAYLLNIARLTEIEEYISELIGRWYHDIDKNDTVIDTLEAFVLRGGSFGTAVGQLSIRASDSEDKRAYVRRSKLKSLKKDIFEPYDYMLEKYPILKNHKYLLPIMWIYRWLCLPFQSMDKVKSHLNGYMHNKIRTDENLRIIYAAVKSVE